MFAKWSLFLATFAKVLWIRAILMFIAESRPGLRTRNRAVPPSFSPRRPGMPVEFASTFNVKKWVNESRFSEKSPVFLRVPTSRLDWAHIGGRDSRATRSGREKAPTEVGASPIRTVQRGNRRQPKPDDPAWEVGGKWPLRHHRDPRYENKHRSDRTDNKRSDPKAP